MQQISHNYTLKRVEEQSEIVTKYKTGLINVKIGRLWINF